MISLHVNTFRYYLTYSIDKQLGVKVFKRRYDLIDIDSPDSVYITIDPIGTMVDYKLIYSTGFSAITLHSDNAHEFMQKLNALTLLIEDILHVIVELETGFISSSLKLMGDNYYSTAGVAFIIDKDRNRARITINDCTRSATRLFSSQGSATDDPELWRLVESWCGKFMDAIKDSLMVISEFENSRLKLSIVS